MRWCIASTRWCRARKEQGDTALGSKAGGSAEGRGLGRAALQSNTYLSFSLLSLRALLALRRASIVCVHPFRPAFCAALSFFGHIAICIFPKRAVRRNSFNCATTPTAMLFARARFSRRSCRVALAAAATRPVNTAASLLSAASAAAAQQGPSQLSAYAEVAAAGARHLPASEALRVFAEVTARAGSHTPVLLATLSSLASDGRFPDAVALALSALRPPGALLPPAERGLGEALSSLAAARPFLLTGDAVLAELLPWLAAPDPATAAPSDTAAALLQEVATCTRGTSNAPGIASFHALLRVWGRHGSPSPGAVSGLGGVGDAAGDALTRPRSFASAWQRAGGLWLRAAGHVHGVNTAADAEDGDYDPTRDGAPGVRAPGLEDFLSRLEGAPPPSPQPSPLVTRPAVIEGGWTEPPRSPFLSGTHPHVHPSSCLQLTARVWRAMTAAGAPPTSATLSLLLTLAETPDDVAGVAAFAQASGLAGEEGGDAPSLPHAGRFVLAGTALSAVVARAVALGDLPLAYAFIEDAAAVLLSGVGGDAIDSPLSFPVPPFPCVLPLAPELLARGDPHAVAINAALVQVVEGCVSCGNHPGVLASFSALLSAGGSPPPTCVAAALVALAQEGFVQDVAPLWRSYLKTAASTATPGAPCLPSDAPPGPPRMRGEVRGAVAACIPRAGAQMPPATTLHGIPVEVVAGGATAFSLAGDQSMLHTLVVSVLQACVVEGVSPPSSLGHALVHGLAVSGDLDLSVDVARCLLRLRCPLPEPSFVSVVSSVLTSDEVPAAFSALAVMAEARVRPTAALYSALRGMAALAAMANRGVEGETATTQGVSSTPTPQPLQPRFAGQSGGGHASPSLGGADSASPFAGVSLFAGEGAGPAVLSALGAPQPPPPADKQDWVAVAAGGGWPDNGPEAHPLATAARTASALCDAIVKVTVQELAAVVEGGDASEAGAADPDELPAWLESPCEMLLLALAEWPVREDLHRTRLDLVGGGVPIVERVRLEAGHPPRHGGVASWIGGFRLPLVNVEGSLAGEGGLRAWRPSRSWLDLVAPAPRASIE